jgi:polar amino acid transport system permease protein
MNAYHWDFSFLGNYKYVILVGAGHTAQLSLVIMFFGMAIGGVFALFRISGSSILRVLGSIYVELFRNVPALVMLFWFFYAIPILTGIQNDRFMTAAVAFSL